MPSKLWVSERVTADSALIFEIRFVIWFTLVVEKQENASDVCKPTYVKGWLDTI